MNFVVLRRLKRPKISIFNKNTYHTIQTFNFDEAEASNFRENDVKIRDFCRLNPNPRQHELELKRRPENFHESRLLNVAIIGKTNAGKSMLTNALVGASVSGVSKRCHTTRKLTQGVTVCGKNQLIFNDTPGFLTKNIKNNDVESSLVADPENSLKRASMILVLHDASDLYNRNRLDYRLQFLLYKFRHLPSILVLNKIDLLKNQTLILELITKLTLARVNGKILRRSFSETLTESQHQKPVPENRQKFDQISKSSKSKPRILMDDDDVIQKQIQQEELSDDDPNSDPNLNFPDLDQNLHMAENFDPNLWPNVDLENLENFINSPMHQIPLNRLKKIFVDQPGWPNFQAVFACSALEGKGLEYLKNFLLEKSRNGPWKFHSSIVSPLSTIDLVKENVRAKVMEKVPFDLPYKLGYKILSWEVNEFDTLCILVEIICDHERFVSMITGPNDIKLKVISKDVSQDLSNLFGRDVYVRFSVRPKRLRPKSSRK